MTTTDVPILLGGVLVLCIVGALLLAWRRGAVREVLPPSRSDDDGRRSGQVDVRLPAMRGRLLWLLVQRGSNPPPAKVDWVAPEVIDEARTLLARRRKIEAIRLVRERTGWGLKESKDFVDGLR